MLKISLVFILMLFCINKVANAHQIYVRNCTNNNYGVDVIPNSAYCVSGPYHLIAKNKVCTKIKFALSSDIECAFHDGYIRYTVGNESIGWHEPYSTEGVISKGIMTSADSHGYPIFTIGGKCDQYQCE